MRSYRYLFILVLILFLFACSSASISTRVFNLSTDRSSVQIPITGADTFQGCGGPVIQSIDAGYEQAVIEKTNEIRMQNGLPPLKHVQELDQSARYHAADMSVNNYFSHDTLGMENGQMQKVCDTWNRIESYYTNWQALAENIAAGQRTPDMAMEGWMNSPDHRRNILSDSFWEIGVGFYEGQGDYHYYWDQNFGKREGSFPLVIDGEKAISANRTVPIYIYGDFQSMRLRNDQGNWSAWQPFQHNVNWQLPSDPGLHTVSAELKGKDGPASASDTIQFTP